MKKYFLLSFLISMPIQSAYIDSVTVKDSAGEIYGPTITSGGVNTLPVSIAGANYVVSTLNSTTTNLAAGATFSGTAENTFNQPSYSILIKADQPGIVTMYQCIDENCDDVAQVLTYPYQVNQGFARSGVVNGNFFKLSFKNTGSSATTKLNVNTAYGTIPSSTQLNNYPVSINEYNPPNTYRSAGASFSFANNATDVLTIKGSNDKIVSVQGFNFECTKTNAGHVDILIVKRSTLNSGGTSSSQTAVPLSSTNPPASAVVRIYTTNPTLGTAVGTVSSLKAYWSTSGSNSGASNHHPGDFNFGREGLRQPIILNNANESVSVNLNGVTHSGNNCSWWVEWLES